MSWLPDETVRHLREIVDWPPLSGTRYEIRERIAQGGMGKVYRARDRDLDREVALKVLSVPRLDDDARARMIREARILARLEHPSIVPIHDVGTLPDGRVYYAMKLMNGSRLDEHARAHPDLSSLLRIFERICEGVAFAHAHGVIHRDLKPENVMVGPFGEVLVMDWGVAKILEEESLSAAGPDPVAPVPKVAPKAPATTSDPDAPTRAETSPPESARTHPGTILGTPGYMPPEQAEGAIHQIDRRSDVFALGAILQRLSGAASGPVPRPLTAVISKAQAADPAGRYTSVEELSADISRFLTDRTVSAYRETIWERVGRTLFRYRTPIAIVLVYVVIRLLILLFAGT